MYKAIIEWKDGTKNVYEVTVEKAPKEPIEDFIKAITNMTKAMLYASIERGVLKRQKEDLNTIQIIQTDEN
jgi:hypothetical protein